MIMMPMKMDFLLLILKYDCNDEDASIYPQAEDDPTDVDSIAMEQIKAIKMEMVSY